MTTSADVLIQGGTVVTEGWVGDATVVVRGGRVAAVLEAGHSPAAGAQQVVDAHGMLVLPGVETRIPVVFSELVARGQLSLRQLAAVTAANPARLNGLYPRKGTIAPGSDADLVVLDPSQTRRVRAADLHMETDYSPYEGLEVTGWPVTVLQRGRVVVDGGQVKDPGPVGEWLQTQALEPSVVGR